MITELGAGEEPATLARAAEWLARGECVALPTETVYGLAADALRPEAVAKIFAAKERPAFDPLIVHLPEGDWLERLTVAREPLVARLAAAFWPGPLTLVLPRQAIVPDLVTAGLETVAVRRSAHPIFAALMQIWGRPLAAPSANRFGRISPTTAAHVRSELGGRIPFIVDGGATEHGVESTILKVNADTVEILRAGPVTREMIADLGLRIADSARIDAAAPEAPGQLLSHYAPRTPLVLLDGTHVRYVRERTGLLAWQHGDPTLAHVEILSPSGDLREAAATLFAKLRRLDEAGLDLILAEPVPKMGLGVAIMDRLERAAHHG